MSPETTLKLATAWYADKMQPAWRRRTLDEAETVFRDLGMIEDFWKLRP